MELTEPALALQRGPPSSLRDGAQGDEGAAFVCTSHGLMELLPHQVLPCRCQVRRMRQKQSGDSPQAGLVPDYLLTGPSRGRGGRAAHVCFVLGAESSKKLP